MSVLQQKDPTLVGGFVGVRSAAVQPEKPRTWLDRRHAKYAAYAQHWDFLRQSYEAGPEYLEANLHQFWREGAQTFADRVRRAHHYAFSRKVVDLFNAYLWQRLPARKRDVLSPALQAFWNDADRAGNDIDVVMMRDASPWAMTCGRYYAVVDKPPEIAQTRAEQRERRLYPYVTFYRPEDVLDARIEDGRPAWVLLREHETPNENPMTGSSSPEDRFRLWTRTEWSLWKLDEPEGSDPKPVLVRQGFHPLGEVPIVPVDHRAPISWFISPSLIWEVAYLDRSIYNHLSLLDAVLYDTTFPQLRIPMQSLPPGRGGDETGARNEARQQVVDISTQMAFTYDASSPTAPDWMAAPTEPAQALMARIKDEIDQLYRHVSLSGEMAEEVSGASGISKEHEFRKLGKLLATQADNLEAAELAMLRLAAKWLGEDPDRIPTDVVDYPDDFDVKTFLDELLELKEMAAADLPAEVLAVAKKEAVSRRFAKLPQADLDALLEAIDSAAASGPEFDVDAALEEIRRRDMEARMMAGGGSTGGGQA